MPPPYLMDDGKLIPIDDSKPGGLSRSAHPNRRSAWDYLSRLPASVVLLRLGQPVFSQFTGKCLFSPANHEQFVRQAGRSIYRRINLACRIERFFIELFF